MIIITFIFGIIIGSFLNVVIWRLPREKSLGGRSECPHCHYTLGPINLVPVFSFLWQRGKCANCHKPMSARYPIIELVTGLLFALAAAHLSSSSINATVLVELLRLLFIIAILIVVFVIDLEHYLILDNIIFPAVIVTLVLDIILTFASHQPFFSLTSYATGGVIAAVLASGFFYLLWRVSDGRWMGFGDVKLALFLGLVLGLPGIAVGLFAAFMIGAVVGVILIIFGQKRLQSQVPFGTFLSVGTLLALFYGPVLAAWYASLIGWR